MNKRVALVGASSTGKTTVYRLLMDRLPTYTFINESTRTVAEYGFPINEKGTSKTQLAISSFHLEALTRPGNLLLDRCYLDLVVYSNNMTGIDLPSLSYIEDTWERVRDKYTHYIYFPIEFKPVDDGVRSINEEWRFKIDQEFKQILNKSKVNYTTVTGSPKQRVDQIIKFLN